jgi:hypothetical protein
MQEQATARANADSSLRSEWKGKVIASANADSSLRSEWKGKVIARANADSSLRSEWKGKVIARAKALGRGVRIAPSALGVSGVQLPDAAAILGDHRGAYFAAEG